MSDAAGSRVIEEIDALYYGKGVDPNRQKAIKLCEALAKDDPAWTSAMLYMALEYYDGILYDQDLDRAKMLMSEATKSEVGEISQFARDWLKFHNKNYSLQNCFECGAQQPANAMSSGQLITSQTVGVGTETTTTFVPERRVETYSWGSTSGSGTYSAGHPLTSPSATYSFGSSARQSGVITQRAYVTESQTCANSYSATYTKQWLCFDCLPKYLGASELVARALEGDPRAISRVKADCKEKNYSIESLVQLAGKFSWACDVLREKPLEEMPNIGSLVRFLAANSDNSEWIGVVLRRRLKELKEGTDTFTLRGQI